MPHKKDTHKVVDPDLIFNIDLKYKPLRIVCLDGLKRVRFMVFLCVFAIYIMHKSTILKLFLFAFW